MQDQSYQAVRAAAERLVANASEDIFALADAIVAAVPINDHGGELAELADHLTTDGVMNARGDAWSVDQLSKLRDTAMFWDKGSRLSTCAFRTHAEHCTVERQAMLRQLHDYAVGKHVPEVPDHIGRRIDARKVRGTKYLVSIDDARLFRGNQPTRHPVPQPTSVKPTAAQLAEYMKDTELVQDALEELPPSERLGVKVAVSFAGERPSQDPDVQHSRSVVRQARAERGGDDHNTDLQQAQLVKEAQKAVHRVIEAFQERRPAPDGFAVLGVRGLAQQVAEAMVLASEDPDEALRRMMEGQS